MAIDLNMDMGAIIKGLLNKQSGGAGSLSSGVGGAQSAIGSYIQAYKIAIIIFALLIVIIVGYVGVIYIPMKDKINKKTEELNKTIEMKNQLAVLDGQIASLKKKLDKSKEEYIASLSHFGNSEDLGDLYQTVSTLAAKYNLVVLNVKEVAAPPPPPVAKPKPAAEGSTTEKKDEKAAAATTATPAEPKKSAVEVKEIKVDIEMKGHYGEYIKFKEDLAIAATLLKVNTESIMVKDDKTDVGSIYVKLNLSTYAIDKKPFQGVVTEKNNEKANETVN